MRKKLLVLFLTLCMITSSLFVVTWAAGDPEITFHSATGGIADVKVTVVSGQVVAAPDSFKRENYTVSFVDESGAAFDLATPITANKTLTAKWTENPMDLTDQNGVAWAMNVDSNGWDKHQGSDKWKTSDGTAIQDQLGVFGDRIYPDQVNPGETNFVTTTGFVMNFNKLDVTKVINISYAIGTSGWGATPGWRLFTFYESAMSGYKTGMSSWNTSMGAKMGLWTSTDATDAKYGNFQVINTYEQSETYLNADFSWETYATKRINLSIYISEDGTQSYIKLNGKTFATIPYLKQSDFIDGYCYLNYLTSSASDNFIKLSQSEAKATVSFAGNCEGFSMPDIKTVKGKKLAKPTAPTIADYTFENWYTNADCTDLFNFEQEITSDVTLYANYTCNLQTFTVKFTSLTGGFTDVTKSVLEGQVVAAPVSFTRENYTVSFVDESGAAFDLATPITANKTLTAKWTENPMDLTDQNKVAWAMNVDSNGWDKHTGLDKWKTSDGTAIQDQLGTYGDRIYPDQVYPGETNFVTGTGFVMNFNKLDVTKVINISYAIGTSGWGVDPGWRLFALYESAMSGYKTGMNSWNTSLGAKMGLWTSTDATDAKYGNFQVINTYEQSETYLNADFSWATYAAKRINLSIYISEDGTQSYIKLNGKTFAKIPYLKQSDFIDGYCYLNYLTSTASDNYIKLSQSEAKATVSFAGNCEGFSMPDTKTVKGQKLARPTAPDITDYTFENWYTNADCTDLFDFEQEILNDVTLYANYTCNLQTFTVKFTSLTGGFADVTKAIPEGKCIAAPVTIVGDRYTVTWLDEAGLAYDFAKPITADLTLTAKWEETPFEVYYKADKGEINPNEPYVLEYDPYGWSMIQNDFSLNESYVEKDGTVVIGKYVGCYNYGTQFKTNPASTHFLLPAVGSMVNNIKLDVTKPIIIDCILNSWNAEGSLIDFSLYESLYRAYQAGHASSQYAKVALQTATGKFGSTLLGKFKDIKNPTLPLSESYNYENKKPFQLQIFISEDGTTNYAKVNGLLISTLPGLKQSDFIGGYCYLQIKNLNSGHEFDCLVKQSSTLNFEANELGEATIENPLSEYNFRDEITLKVTAKPGYIVKNVTVGGVDYEADSAGYVVFRKGFGNETVVLDFAKICKATFNTNGGNKIEDQHTYVGGTFIKPTRPKKEGFKFEGWYMDSALSVSYDFTTLADKDITLYAKWTKIEEEIVPPKGGCNSSSISPSSFGGGSLLFIGLLSIALVVVKKKAVVK